MELLFIIFVIYMIFSAIAKALRAAAGEKDEPSQQDESFPLFQAQEHDEQEPMQEREIWLPPATEEYLPPQEQVYTTTLDEQQQFAAKKEKETSYKQRKMPRAVQKAKTAQTLAFKPDLGQLMQGKNLPLAIIATEILAAPRSKRTYSPYKR